MRATSCVLIYRGDRVIDREGDNDGRGEMMGVMIVNLLRATVYAGDGRGYWTEDTAGSGVRVRRPPLAVAHREELPDVQA
jgi:hypothetical protein